MKFKSFEEGLARVPATLTDDPLWRMEAYRLATFVADVGWHDVVPIGKDRRMIRLADQLYRSLGSVGANIAEGYSRRSGKARARFYEYALGSAREARHWYYTARHTLDADVISHRVALLTQIVRLLLTMIPRRRRRNLSEPSIAYRIPEEGDDATTWRREFDTLLQEIPSI